MLTGKRILITGVLTRRSIAYAIAEAAQRRGADVVLTSFGRARRLTERSSRALPAPPDVLELDVTNDEHLAAVRADLERRWGALDGVVHAIAYAPPDAIGARFLDTPAASAEVAFRTSAFSLKSLAVALLPLLERGSSPSVVGLDFDASVAWPLYDWMGVAKAALEAVNRYLARELGPHGVRANLVAPGPLSTPAASALPALGQLASAWSSHAPLGWDALDTAAVADPACFLLSDMARAISGQIVHVDGGFRAVGAAAADPGAAEPASGNGKPANGRRPRTHT